MNQLPLIDLGADAHERGIVHGQALPDQIRANIETYVSRFAAGGLDRAAILTEGERWAARIAGFNPDYAVEMEGIAAGADLPLGAIGMLNARYETAYSLFARETRDHVEAAARAEGCTGFGSLPEGTLTNTTLIGQNWDWLKGVRGQLAVLRVRPADAPAFLCVTQAGIVGGMIGLNETGLGLCVNGMTTDREGENPDEKPFHVRVREILTSDNLTEAMKVVLSTDRVCSANFLLGHADGEVVDIEAAPSRANVLYPDADGLLTHSNHFMIKDGIESTLERLHPGTLIRAPRLARLLKRHQAGIDMQVIQAALTDHFSHPSAICRHEDPKTPDAERTITVTSVILALAERTLYATDGPPCENPYHGYQLE